MKIATLSLFFATAFLTGNSALAANGSFDSITVTHNASISGWTEIDGYLLLTDPNEFLSVAGTSSFGKALTAADNVSFTGASKQFTVAGTSTFNGNTTAAGDVTFSGSAKQFTVAGTSTLNGNTTVTKPFTASDFVYFNGAQGSGTIAPSFSGATFLWYTRKAALRAGYVDNGSWTDANIGYQSVAFGFNSLAYGNNATAFSAGSATGNSSFAGGNSYANGANAFAYGQNAGAVGQNSFALGRFVEASTFSSFVIGQYSEDVATTASNKATTWIPEDPLFVVGNGTSATARGNAFIVYKDGTIIMPKPQGDIDMGIYGE